MEELTIRNKIFSDLDLDFIAHPNTRKLTSLTQDKAVIRSLKNLIMTNHYDRPFHPEIGCGIRESLFDNILPSTASTIHNTIVEVIDNFEPRVNLTNVDVRANPDKNRYDVRLVFFILNRPESRTVNFFLERIR
jgi:uncharacterized protein